MTTGFLASLKTATSPPISSAGCSLTRIINWNSSYNSCRATCSFADGFWSWRRRYCSLEAVTAPTSDGVALVGGSGEHNQKHGSLNGKNDENYDTNIIMNLNYLLTPTSLIYGQKPLSAPESAPHIISKLFLSKHGSCSATALGEKSFNDSDVNF